MRHTHLRGRKRILSTKAQRRVITGDSLRAVREGDIAVLQVTDTGAGMSEAARRRIFEPFFTTKDAGEKASFGLALSQGILESHRGAIAVESEVGVGTSFTMLLPTLDASAILSEDNGQS